MKHQIIRCLGVGLLLLSLNSFAQSVGIGTETPNSNAILELVAPNANQGLLVPRVSTAERTATTFTDNLSATDNGLLIYDEDEGKFYFWVINQWVEIASGNIDALPDQTGQNNRYLQTDGTNAQWADIDFTTLSNIPAGLSDGDNDTQLSDADIIALGYIKNADDADSDPANEFQDLSLSGNTLSLTNSAINVDLTPFAGTNTDNQTLGLTGTDLSISGGNTLDVSSLVNDADFDPTNEDQTVSAGTGISVNQVGDDFEVTNTSPDQTVSLSNGGNVTVTGTYPNFTLAVPNNLDNDPTNEDQTVSAGTGISVNQVGDDFEVTNTSPDQTVSLSNGGNVTVTGTYPNFTLAVPNNLDNDPTNEDQTVSAGTGISVNQVGDDFEVTNTSPDQTVSISNGGNVTVTGTYPNFTLAVPNNLDNDPTNEDQTVSAGTGISVNQVGDDFEVTNASPDQTVSISNGGNVTVTGTYPNFTLAVPNNLDNDPTNEDQTVSAGTGISVNQVGDDFEVTNTSPDQTVSISNGGNVTVTGTYPNFTLAVPNNLDNDPTNEDQTVSAGTGISISQTGDDFEVTNTSPDQTVSLSNGGNVTITGTYPNFTLSVPTNNDNSATNEIELPTQTGQNGNFLTTDGTNPSWASIAESQWNTNGTSINYQTGNVNIGSGTIPTSRLQLSTNNSGSTTPQLRLLESDGTSDASMNFNSGGTNFAIGVDGGDNYFKISESSALGSNDRIIIDNTGAVGIGANPFAQFHVTTSGTLEGSAIRTTNNHSGAGLKIGLNTTLDNQGSAEKRGVSNTITGTTSSTQSLRGVYNVISPTDGTTWGTYSQINNSGTGLRYGSQYVVSAGASNGSDIYGSRANVTHSGSGTAYGYYANVNTTGDKFGFFSVGDAKNVFEGNVGIGGDLDPSHLLSVISTTTSSTNPMVRIRAGNSSSDAAVYMNIQGGGNFTYGIDATESTKFKISNSTVLGTNDRLVLTAAGELGLNQNSPSAVLDVVGDSELNGQVSGDDFVYTTGNEKSYVYGLSGADFTTGESSLSFPSDFASFYEVRYTGSFYSEFLLRGGSSVVGTIGQMAAPIHLPQGATITQIEVFGRNSSTSNAMTVTLYQASFSTGSSNTVIGTIPASTGSVARQINNTGLSISIDNVNVKYTLVIDAEVGALGITGVKVHYTKTSLD